MRWILWVEDFLALHSCLEFWGIGWGMYSTGGSIPEKAVAFLESRLQLQGYTDTVFEEVRLARHLHSVHS